MQICCPICTRTAVARILAQCRIVAAGEAEVGDLSGFVCTDGHIFFLHRDHLSARKSVVRADRSRTLPALRKQRNIQTSEKHERTQA